VPTNDAPGPAGVPGLPAELAGCRDAEDWFAALGVGYDPAVLAVLRLFGRELQDVDAADPAAVRAALERSYRALADAGPLEHRVFKVLQDRAPRQFVPLAQVTAEGAGDG